MEYAVDGHHPDRSLGVDDREARRGDGADRAQQQNEPVTRRTDGSRIHRELDYSVGRNASGDMRVTATPAGVRVIDTGSWTSRMLEPEAMAQASDW